LRKLEAAAEEWRDRGKKPDDLLQGRALTNAQQFQKEQAERDSLNPLVESFITKSIKQRRNNRLKLVGLGLVMPLGLAIFGGIQIERNVRIRSNWAIVNQASGKVDNPARIAALRALVSAGESLQGINLEEANLISASLRSADLSSANLHNANLILANLFNADLSGADLSSAYLRSAYLFNADLSGANLYGADLSSANLSNANLFNADLSSANLSNAHLSNAHLRSANLRSAVFLSTNLLDTKELTQQQLEGENAPLLCNVALPQNSLISVNPNRDCDRLPQILLERYPKEFITLGEAKAYVDEARKEKWDN